MARSKISTKLSIFVFIVLLALVGLVGYGIYKHAQIAQVPKDDSYFWDKYGTDPKNHDACVSDFNKHGQTGIRLIAIPCPGEPQ